MSVPPPIIFTWDGDAMVPLARFVRLCDKTFAVGATYPLVVQEQRSQATHAHYFASINDRWQSLPDDIAERWPTAEHLRKFALIKTGYADERSIVCGSKAEALRVAAFIRPMDDYAIVVASEAVVKVFTAKSQSMRAMGREDFQASKQAVLDFLDNLLGIETEVRAA